MATDWSAAGKGVLGGAGAGAAIGSVVPGIGTAIGAAGGALLGGISGIFSGSDTPAGPDYTALNSAAQMQAIQNMQQQQVFIQALQGQMNGAGGPSVAQAMLANQTSQNQRLAAGAAASQRGLSPALQARLALQQGAQLQQESAGQGAALRAQEQMALRQQLGQAMGQQGAMSTGALGVASGAGGAQAQLAQQWAMMQNQNNQNMLGGALGGLGAAAAMRNRGWQPNIVPATAAPAVAAAPAVGGSTGTSPYIAWSHGGAVGGQASVPGDSPQNDVVKARLSPGEVVIPRSVMQSADPAGSAAAFVAALQKQQAPGMACGGMAGYADGGEVLPGAVRGWSDEPSSTPEGAQLPAPEPVPGAVRGWSDEPSALPQAPVSPDQWEPPSNKLPPLQLPQPKEVGRPAPTASGIPQGLENAQRQEQAAQSNIGMVAQQKADAESAVADAALRAQQEIQTVNQATLAKRQANADRMYQDYSSSKLDPNQYWNDIGTGGRISSAIGLILGGIGAGITHGPNMAMQVIDKAIDRDIESQKFNISKKANALSHYLSETGDIRQAMVLAKADARDVAAAQMVAAGAKFGGEQAFNSAQLIAAQLKKQGIADRMNMSNLSTDTQLKSLQLAQTKIGIAQQQNLYNQLLQAGESGQKDGGASNEERLLNYGFAAQGAEGIAKKAAQTVNVPMTQKISTGAGGEATKAVTIPRLAHSPEAAQKAREAFLSTGMIRDKLAVLEELAQKGRLGTAFSAEDQQRAKAAVSGIKESYERGFNLVNAQPSEKTIEAANDIVKDPTKWLQLPGTITGSLKYMKDDLDRVESGARRMYLFPRKGD